MFTTLTTAVRQQALGALALFVALGGTSYAVATGSIDSRELKNNSIRSKDLKNNDVRSGDVRNGSLLSRDFRPGQLAAGARGATGATGARGPSDGYYKRDGNTPGDHAHLAVEVPAGHYVASGGARVLHGGVGGPSGTGACTLHSPQDSAGNTSSGEATVEPVGGASTGTAFSTAGFRLARPGTIELFCVRLGNDENPVPIEFMGARLTAIRVATLH